MQKYKSVKGLIVALASRNILKMSDEKYIRLKYKLLRGKDLNLEEPTTFNEKLQYLKLHDRKLIYTKLVDKFEVRDFIKNTLGEQYLIPLIGVWDKFEQIDFEKLPNQFVLKCTHDSASVIICKDKTKFNIKKAKKKIEKCMKINFYYKGREWPYKNVKPRIIAEKYMVDESGTELKDYKIFNFNGIPKLIEVDFDRFVGHKRNVYDTNWNYVEMDTQYPSDKNRQIKRPENLEEMLNCAKKLAKDFPFLRTDFYNINGKIYFGEMTLYHGSGFSKIEPEKYQKLLGDWIDLKNIGGK